MVDLFGNNVSNDYIIPTLADCAGQSDSAAFEFLNNQQVGVISGSEIIASMGLGDISQPVTGWVTQTKLLSSGEVVFIQGLTKGISYRSQYFLLDGSVIYTGSNDPYYLSVDISINYYKNFRYYQDSVRATGDYTNGITIENAINLAFDAKGITVTSAYDASGLSFVGDVAGYSFDITSINASLFETSSDIGKTLTEDESVEVPAFKYPNGAMLGYVLKVTYPTTAEDYEKYIKINHVPDYLTYYETVDASILISGSVWEVSTYYTDAKEVSIFISPATWAPAVYFDLDLNPKDVSVFLTDAIWESSIYSNTAIDVSVLISPEVWDTSTIYINHRKAIDVGLSGASCTGDTMSAAEYLDWVETNEQWEKVGVLRIWLSAEDPDNSNVENLITGFYVYNPQTFPVQISYMTIL